MAMMTALSAVILLQKLVQRISSTALKPGAYMYVLFVPLIIPYYHTLTRTLQQTEDVAKHESYYKVTNYLRTILKESPDKNWKLYSTEYSAHNWWYIMRMKNMGSNFSYTTNVQDVRLSDTVLCYETKAMEKLEELFVLDTLIGSDLYLAVPKEQEKQ